MINALNSIANFFVSIWDTIFNIWNFIISVLKFIINGIWTIFNGLSYLGDMVFNTSLFDSLSWFTNIADWVYWFLGYWWWVLFMVLSIILLLSLFSFILRLMRWFVSFNKSDKVIKKSFK